jgi:hypothetical protein
MSRTLVIHPDDPTTRFVSLAYRGLDADVVANYLPPRQLWELMERYDRIMMAGHGAPAGLFWPKASPRRAYLVDANVLGPLREREDSIFFWCHASHFVARHQLNGFATGMFISEPREASWMGVEATGEEVAESNYIFVNILSRFITQPVHVLRAAVSHEYGRLAEVNPVARYNLAQLDDWGRQMVA